MSAPSDFSTDSDADLLGYMACRESDPGVARAAWAEFFVRHRAYLYGCAARWGRDREDVVSETFRRVFDIAVSYDAGRLQDAAEPIRVRTQVRAWLGSVMNRTAIEMLRAGNRAGSPGQVDNADMAASPPAPADPADPAREAKLAAVREAVESMSEREQEILWAVAQWGGPQRLPLPADVLAGICQRYCTTPENVRKIRERAIKKVRERLATHAGPVAAPKR